MIRTFLMALSLGMLVAPAPARAWEIAGPVVFQDGDAAMRNKLRVLPMLRELIAEQFGYAMVDLDDDGGKELVVIARSADFCGSGGCRAMVVQLKRGQAPRTLLDQYLVESLAVTREKAGGYRALAVLLNGAIQRGDMPGSPLHGKPMVYPMGGTVASAETAPTKPEQAAAPGPSGTGPDVLGIRLSDSSPADVRKLLGALKGPKDRFGENQNELVTQDGVHRVKVPGSAHVGVMSLRKPGQGCPENEGCDEVVVHFSEDPGAERVMHLYRRYSFPAVPYDTLLQSMTAKWGAPSGIEERWHLWVWRSDGARVDQLAKSSPCWKARDLTATYNHPDSDTVRTVRQALLQGGCARVVAVAAMSRRQAGLVDEQRTGMFDAQLSERNAERRQQRIDAFMAQRQQGRRQEAERNPQPRL